LEGAGLPFVVFLILSPGYGEHSLLKDDYIRYIYVDPFSEFVKSHKLSISIIKTDAISNKYENIISGYVTHEIIVEKGK
jgi:hypothetical protein